MHTLRRVVVTLTACVVFGTSFLTARQDQGPVIKPSTEPLAPERLPAPKPTAQQGADGRITVTWAAVDGAVRYRLWRSVPPAPTAPLTQPNPEQPGYIDADVKAGSTYYYVVSAIDADGVEGLKAGTAPLTASLGTTVSAPKVSAQLLALDPPRVRVTVTLSPGVYGYTLRRTVSSASLPPAIETLGASGTSFEDALPSQPYARTVVYQAESLVNGSFYLFGRAEVVIPPASGTTDSSTGSTSASAATVAGTTTLTVAVPATVALGATTSLSAAVGSSARWLSLDESVATVDSSGTITGRAAGHTRILALSSAADGSLRVVAIAVVVRP